MFGYFLRPKCVAIRKRCICWFLSQDSPVRIRTGTFVPVAFTSTRTILRRLSHWWKGSTHYVCSLFFTRREERRLLTQYQLTINTNYISLLSVIISNNSHDNLLQLTHIYTASSPQRDLIGGTGVCSDGVTSLCNEAIPWCCLPVLCCINSTYMYGLNKWHYMRDVDGVFPHIVLLCVALAYGSILLRFEMFSILHFIHTVANFYLHH